MTQSKKLTDISNKVGSLTSIQFEIKETSEEKKNVNNSNDRGYYQKKLKNMQKIPLCFIFVKMIKCKKSQKSPADSDSIKNVNPDFKMQN